MTRNFHQRFIGNPKYYGTAAETAAENIEELITRKSWAVCDDAIDWDAIIECAQSELIAALKA